MARSTFSGPVRSLNGFISTGNSMAQSIGGSTVDGGTDVAGIDKYQGKVTQVTDAVTIFNLPEIVIDTGSDASKNSPGTTSTIGLEYGFVMSENLTSTNTFTLNAGTAAGRSTADIYEGILWYANTAADPHPTSAWTAGSTDTLTLDATTRGGLCGSTIYVRAVGANMWTVNAYVTGVGTQATPWS